MIFWYKLREWYACRKIVSQVLASMRKFPEEWQRSAYEYQSQKDVYVNQKHEYEVTFGYQVIEVKDVKETETFKFDISTKRMGRIRKRARKYHTAKREAARMEYARKKLRI